MTPVILVPGAIVQGNLYDADLLPTHVISEPTLVRLRGEYAVWPAAAAASAAAVGWGAVGIIEADDPVADEPPVYSPIDDADADWIWYQYFHVTGHTDFTQSFPYGAFERYQIDSKAQRRLEEKRSIMFYIESDFDSDFNISVHLATRMLFRTARG